MKEALIPVADYEQFVKQMHGKTSIDLSLYKEQQMRRRLTSLRNKRGFQKFNDYYLAMEKDETMLEELVDRMTINVTEFYRNPKRWDVLRDKVIPKLIENKQHLKIWSAACSSGEEPYSLAILFREYYPHVKVNILATDLDVKALEKARQGIYDEQALKTLPANKKAKYFTFENNNFTISNHLKPMITFKKHNLLDDAYPKNIDLIICRNVMIYFTDQAKDYVYQQFSQALRKEGVLFVGSTEQIFTPDTYNLALYDTFFYEKK